jgi:hypothetical protein
MPIRTLQTLSAGVVTREICPVAGTVMVHVRIEQVWQIMGQPSMKTIDTVIDATQLSGISVDQLIQAKYGPGCPPGKIPQGDACVEPR